MLHRDGMRIGPREREPVPERIEEVNGAILPCRQPGAELDRRCTSERAAFDDRSVAASTMAVDTS